MGRKESLIYTRVVRLQGHEPARVLGSPLMEGNKKSAA